MFSCRHKPTLSVFSTFDDWKRESMTAHHGAGLSVRGESEDADQLRQSDHLHPPVPVFSDPSGEIAPCRMHRAQTGRALQLTDINHAACTASSQTRATQTISFVRTLHCGRFHPTSLCSERTILLRVEKREATCLPECQTAAGDTSTCRCGSVCG